jgi:7SK snRNA methylphosphate capping enzyme
LNLLYIILLTRIQANYILQNQQLLEHEKEEFDAILCLSITKWIHLNHGDNGIEFLFKRIFKQLRSGGILVLEAQAYETYKKRSKLSPQILENYRNIKLKPDKFESYLMSEKIGFSETWRVADGKDLKNTVKAKGFCRTLQIFIKS